MRRECLRRLTYNASEVLYAAPLPTMPLTACTRPVDTLPRYPCRSTCGVLRGCDYVGTCAFGFSGALTASLCHMDLLGSVAVGITTAVGGGTFRDVLFGQTPVCWLKEGEYFLMAMASAAAGFAYVYYQGTDRASDEKRSKRFEKILLGFDTVGLAAFSVVGGMAAMRLGHGIGPTLMAALLTSTGGGVVRDVLCQHPVRVLHGEGELYASAAIVGGLTTYVGHLAGAPTPISVAAAFSAVVAIRMLAVTSEIKLPVCVEKVDSPTLMEVTLPLK
jgi:uncharacterized membrane protein YeiH